jgi:ATP:ADP antiporter, AAA family
MERNMSLFSRTFVLMFSIVLLLNIDFTILKSVRNTLAVVDLGKGASTIPIFELFGALPGSILMAWGLNRLLNNKSIQKVFLITIVTFLGFFLIFALGIYPYLITLKKSGGGGTLVLHFFSMLFYVMSELWKPALAMILFWGLVNQHIPASEAKKLYAPLMLGSSIGGILAGPLVSTCTSEFIWKNFTIFTDRWMNALGFMMLIVSILGALAAFLYYKLWICFSENTPIESSTQSKNNSLKESVLVCMQTPELRCLSWIVITDYIAYSLGEVIFLDILKHRYSEAHDYCNYMGILSSWSGALTVLSALIIAPRVLQNCRWVVAAIVTPICLLMTEGSFFLFLRIEGVSRTWFGWSESEWIGVIIILGSLQYCICRAAKYTLFDASKELAFVMMPDFQKMKGKLVIDGICARLGRGGASALSIALIQISGGVIASSFLSGIMAMAMTISWITTTCKLGRLFEKRSHKESN